MINSFSTFLKLSLLVANLPTHDHSCQCFVYIFDIKIRFDIGLRLRNGMFVYFRSLTRNIFLFCVLFIIKSCRHRAYPIYFCLFCLRLLIKILTFFRPNILIVIVMGIFFRIGLESALWVLLMFFELSDFLFF